MVRIILLGIIVALLGCAFIAVPAWLQLDQSQMTETATSTSQASTTPDTIVTGTTIPPGQTSTGTIEPDTVTVPPTPVPIPTPQPIPVPTPEPTLGDGTFVRTVQEREGSFLIQAIFPDRVDGLWYMAHPVPREEGEPYSVKVGDDIGYACEGISIKVISIDAVRKQVTFQKKTGPEPVGGCPICLSSDTLIDTPTGQVPVTSLVLGHSVFTVDQSGKRVTAEVEELGSTVVPKGHTVVVLTLSDGRTLTVSPGHPTVDGRTVGALTVGDTYDGSMVASRELVRYNALKTYDLRPSGETGFYFANGILLGSTLLR